MSRNIRDWFRNIRTGSLMCMLIPMEASMGYPIEVKNGEEYMLPFYKTDIAHKVCYPPFAYVRVSFPKGEILAYNDLRCNRAWSEVDREAPIGICDSYKTAGDYYEFLSNRVYNHKDTELSADEVLRECIACKRSGLIEYYDLLIKEKVKF